MAERTYTVRDLCERYGVNEHTVLGWIAQGELRAINVGRSPDRKKPRWRITAEALATFEQLRTPTPQMPQQRRRNQTGGDVVEFYK